MFRAVLVGGSRTIGLSTSGRPASPDGMMVDERVACAVVGELEEGGRVIFGLCGKLVDDIADGSGTTRIIAA